MNITLSVETVNQILSLLGRLPFIESNNLIQAIVQQANEQLVGQQEEDAVEEQ